MNYIFGYGSLINLVSLSKTLTREVNISEVLPVIVRGYRRVWNLGETVVSAQTNEIVRAVFLNLEPDALQVINGIVFQVSDAEFEYLKLRERNYQCVALDHVSSFFKQAPAPFFEIRPFTFLATDNRYLTQPDAQDHYVMENYISLLSEGCQQFGHDFDAFFWKTTSKNTFPIYSGRYTFT